MEKCLTTMILAKTPSTFILHSNKSPPNINHRFNFYVKMLQLSVLDQESRFNNIGSVDAIHIYFKWDELDPTVMIILCSTSTDR